MTVVKTEVVGLIDALQSIQKDFQDRVRSVVKDTARYAKGKATATRLFEDKTGYLRRSTKAEFVPSQYRSAIVNAAPHAEYVEKGTSSHIIRPVRARKLRFFWKKVGQVVEFDQVNHPGTKPRPFFKSAGFLGHTFLEHHLSRAVEDTVARFNRGK